MIKEIQARGNNLLDKWADHWIKNWRGNFAWLIVYFIWFFTSYSHQTLVLSILTLIGIYVALYLAESQGKAS